MRSNRLMLVLCLTIVALAMAAWLVVSVGDLHDRLAKVSPLLALGFAGLAVVTTFVFALASARLFWKLGRADRPPPKAPADVVKAAEIQAVQAEKVIERVRDEGARARLNGELASLRADRDRRRFHVVVFGTGSAGKTSLINAILGEEAGKTEAVMGTTRRGENHTYTIEGLQDTLVLTDTPGLSEIGEGGAAREAEARDLAARADLLLFVVDHDLIRSEHEPLIALARQGKRSIVVLNKKDRFPDPDLKAILGKLRERLGGVVPPADVVATAASPRPVPVRVRRGDGTVETILEVEPPEIDALIRRIEAVLAREGDALRAGNLLLRAHLLTRQAQDVLGRQRRDQAKAVIERYQWITAGTVFANPIPAFDLMATGAVQFQMISELAAVYGVELSSSHIKMVGAQMIQMLLKLGIVEAATSLIAGVFKSSMIGYAAGGAVQSVTMAYLTHVSGLTMAEYFERGQTWGDGGMQAALVRQFDLNSRADFLQEFAKQALDRVVHRVVGVKDGGAGASAARGKVNP
jgi:small GTP-binding protein